MAFSGPGSTARSRTRPWLGLIVVATLFLGTGCSLLGGSSSSPSTGSNNAHLEKSTIRVGAISAISSAPLYIALQKGYFSQQGLDVQPVVTQGGAQAIPQLLSGGLDLTLTNDMTAITAQLKKTADLRFVFDGIQTAKDTYTVDVLPGSGIRSIADLAGKTVSISSPDDIVALSLQQSMKDSGIDPSTVRFSTVPYADTEQALKTHQVDAVTQTEPYTTKTERDTGATPAVDVFAQGTATYQMPNAAYVATTKFTQQNPNTIAAFQRAMAKAARDAASRPAVEQIVPTYTKIDKDTVRLIALPTFPADLDATRLQRVVTLMKNAGKVTTPFQVSSMIVPVASS